MNPDDTLIARARRSVSDKADRGIYTADLLHALNAPLDLQPNPEVAGGAAWAEAVRTTVVTVGPPPPSPRPVVGSILTAAKRLVARALSWYLPPVVAQVTSHNRAVIDVLSEHNRQIVELHRELELLRSRLAELEVRAERGRATRDSASG